MTSAPVDELGARRAAHSRRWWTLATVALAQLMVVLDATVVNIALPAAQADLGFSDGDRQWIITAYSLAFGSLLLLGGRLSDLWGRKRTFIIGLIGFAVASALAGAAPTFGVLVAGSRAAGGVRRPARPDRARSADHDVHDPARARPRVRRLRRDRGSRRRHRPPARRVPHRAVQLALEPLHQRVHRGDRGDRRRCCSSPRRPHRPASEARPARHRARLRRPVPARLRLLERRDRGLGLADDVGHARGIRACCSSCSCSGSAAPRTRCCRSPIVLDRNRGAAYISVFIAGARDVRHLPVRHLLPADVARLLADPDRPGVPADDRSCSCSPPSCRRTSSCPGSVRR